MADVIIWELKVYYEVIRVNLSKVSNRDCNYYIHRTLEGAEGILQSKTYADKPI